jgi:predicted membrane metal-binding protein
MKLLQRDTSALHRCWGDIDAENFLMRARRPDPLLACAPLAVAVAVFATMGNFGPGYVMLVAGTAALIGGALRRKHPGVE